MGLPPATLSSHLALPPFLLSSHPVLPLQENYTVNPTGDGDRASPYKDGMFRLRIILSDTYPTEAPTVSSATSTSGQLQRATLLLAECFAVPMCAALFLLSSRPFMHALLLHFLSFFCLLLPSPVPPPSTLQVMFQTRVWHPQIDAESGKPCVDFLKEQWKPTSTLRDILVAMRQLLASPSSTDSVNSAAASEIGSGWEAFEKHAAEETAKYAMD